MLWTMSETPDTQETLLTLRKLSGHSGNSLDTLQTLPENFASISQTLRNAVVHVYSITDIVRHMYSETLQKIYISRRPQPNHSYRLIPSKHRCKPSNIPLQGLWKVWYAYDYK